MDKCLNAGLLSNNVCICLPGFIGLNCEIKISDGNTENYGYLKTKLTN